MTEFKAHINVIKDLKAKRIIILKILCCLYPSNAKTIKQISLI
eukprot:gene6767-10931_t